MKSTDNLGRLVGLETADAANNQQVVETAFAGEAQTAPGMPPAVRHGTPTQSDEYRKPGYVTPAHLDAFPQYPACGFCGDKGLTFNEFNHYRFCTCNVGKALALVEPLAAIQANEAYIKVQMIGSEASK